MNASARSSIANVTSPPAPSPAARRRARGPRGGRACGSTSSRSASGQLARRAPPAPGGRVIWRYLGVCSGRSPSVTSTSSVSPPSRMTSSGHRVARACLSEIRRARSASSTSLLAVDRDDHVAADGDLRRPGSAAPGRRPRCPRRRRGCRGRPRRSARRCSASMSSRSASCGIEGLGRDPDVGVLGLAVVAQLVDRALAPGPPAPRSRRPRRRRDAVRICWLIPSTRPSASSSGPPELPGLIAASVWIASSIWKSVSDSTERPVAEITPTESEFSSPNGLPIAATGWPTWISELRPELERDAGRVPPGSTLSSATSANGSKPTTSAGTWFRSGNST